MGENRRKAKQLLEKANRRSRTTQILEPHAGPGTAFSRIRAALPSKRGMARLVAASANVAMLMYIYCTYLADVEWSHFRQHGNALPELHGLSTSTRSSADIDFYIDLLGLSGYSFIRGFLTEHHVVLTHLKAFSFSDAMLQHLTIFMLVGTSVAIVYILLERDRIRWLQSLVRERMPDHAAQRATWWLELYLWTLSVAFVFILLLVPFHVDLPKAHYPVAACAITLGCTSLLIYLFVPIDFNALAEDDNDEVATWAWRVQWRVRPALKFVLWLHAFAGVAAVLKVQSLGDDRLALLFGVLETSVILGYQLSVGVFAVDDLMIENHVPASKAASALVKSDERGLER